MSHPQHRLHTLHALGKGKDFGGVPQEWARMTWHGMACVPRAVRCCADKRLSAWKHGSRGELKKMPTASFGHLPRSSMQVTLVANSWKD